MPYRQRLEWAKSIQEIEDSNCYYYPVSCVESTSCFAYSGYLTGLPHGNENRLALRFDDGILAQLPLPSIHCGMGSATPDTMAFQGDRFVYSVIFAEAEIMNSMTIHEAGTYFYTVNLRDKTVSLSIR